MTQNRSLSARVFALAALFAAAAAACVPGVDPGDSIDIPPVAPPSVAPPREPITGPGNPLGGTVVSAAKPPPALSGGTLQVLSDGKTAFAADPDRDALYFADLTTERLLARVPLQPGDEPGRVVETREGDLLVILRRGNAVVEVSRQTQAVVARVPVCGAPRGIDHDPDTGLTYVACATGELVTLAPGTREVTRRLLLDPDLRDVVVTEGKLMLSRFRSAELLVVDAAEGRLIERRRPPGSEAANQMVRLDNGGGTMGRAASPGVAYRMRHGRGGAAMMLHQEASNAELGTQSGGYSGGPCKTAMGAALSEFSATPGDTRTSGMLMGAVLPLDFALSRQGNRLAVVAAGEGPFRPLQNVIFMDVVQTSQPGRGGCVFPPPPTDPNDPIEFRQPVGRPIAVAFDGQDRVVVQTRDPARLEIVSHRGGTILLDSEARVDTGHDLFHMVTGNGLACASCHPEGGDDGRIWRFAGLGARRTQSLRGGILATAPFHWDGDMPDLRKLMSDVFTMRMGGPQVGNDHVQALATWMDRLPALPRAPLVDELAVARGERLFQDAKVGCATCHTGPAFTNNATIAVGTGRALQVPSLRGLRARAPYLHNGCAPTLLDRFDPRCGGGDQHGVTSTLSSAQLADLAAYLDTL
jgi:mono/diheme cytochrome c family protein